jgi:hypothetical protein
LDQSIYLTNQEQMLDSACDFRQSQNVGKNAEPHHFIGLIGQIVMDQNMLCNVLVELLLGRTRESVISFSRTFGLECPGYWILL